jgi:murein DD-endopeptidase MepM/ murein hydrolase activator NlpD
MRRLWTTAAAAALCVLAADAWAAPYGGQLELVATNHHHLRGAESSDAAVHRHGKAKAKTSSESRHERRSRRGAKLKKTDEAPAHGRRGRHHAEAPAAADEATPTRGRHGRHHAEAAAAEATTHGRHARHGRAAPSEIRTESGGTVEVGRHDTLDSISHDTGVLVAELARLNHLKKPYHIRKGAKLKLPARRYYVVKSGETIYALARKFGVESAELAAANSMGHGRSLRAGQRLYLPGGAHEAAPVEEEAPPPERATVRRPTPRSLPPSIAPILPAPSGTPYARPPAESEASPQTTAPTATTPPTTSQDFELTPTPRVPPPRPYQPLAPPPGHAIIQTSPAPSASDVANAGRGKFIWPVSGSLISVYGVKPDGERNDGLNIAANPGDPVRAAADGEVVYAGDQVPSFGNLVLIKHQGGWVTAYAHMGRIMVHNRDQVVQGQQIGSIGQTGSVDRPQLHFEIRYAPSAKDKATPVDPALVLPPPQR